MKKTKHYRSLNRSWYKEYRRIKCANTFQLLEYIKPKPYCDNTVYALMRDLIAPAVLEKRKEYPKGTRLKARERYCRKWRN